MHNLVEAVHDLIPLDGKDDQEKSDDNGRERSWDEGGEDGWSKEAFAEKGDDSVVVEERGEKKVSSNQGFRANIEKLVCVEGVDDVEMSSHSGALGRMDWFKMLNHIARNIEILELGKVGKDSVHFFKFVSVKTNGSEKFVLVEAASLYTADFVPWHVNDL